MGLLLYRYIVAGRETHVEVVCQRHYDEQSQIGGGMEPLTDAEKRRRCEQIVTPYTGDRGCETCEEEAERGTAA